MRSVLLVLAIVAFACARGYAQPPHDLAGLYLGFAAEGLAKDDDGNWGKAYRVCTTVPVVVTAEYLYGFMVEHCVTGRLDFVVKRYLVFNEALDMVEAEVSGSLGNEIVAWRAPNLWGRGSYALATGGVPDPRREPVVYYCGLWKTDAARKPICATGQVMGDPNRYMSGLGNYYVGDLVFTGPAYWGFSGAPIFVLRDGRYEIVALVNAFSVFSNISFGLSVPRVDVRSLWEGQQAPSPQKPIDIVYPSGADGWPQEYRDFWGLAYLNNAIYTVKYETGEYSLTVSYGGREATFSFSDPLSVMMALVNGKIALVGKMQDVAWGEFVLSPVSLKAGKDGVQGGVGIGIGVPLKIEITIPIDEPTKRVMYDSFVALESLADSLNFYARVQLYILLAFALANAIVLGILLVTDARVRKAASRAYKPFMRMGKAIALRLRGG